MVVKLIVLLSMLTLLLACTQPVPSAQPAPTLSPTQTEADQSAEEPSSPAAEFIAADCPFETFADDPISCGYLTVPEQWANPDGPQIELAVAIIHSERDTPLTDPILYLEGGPGGSALSDPDSWIESPLRGTRDIILLDQRGTGFSQPGLHCPVSDTKNLVSEAKACLHRLLVAGIDLTAYDSAASATDIEALRLALGYEQWNLLGISYGTRLALTVMRDHPQGVRAVILDSVYPPNVDAYTEQAKNYADAIQALLDGCASDATCQQAYPDLTDQFYSLIADLNEYPLEVEDEAFLYGDDVIFAMIDALYDTALIPQLPSIIAAAYDEEYDPILDLVFYEVDGFHTLRQNDDAEIDLSDADGMFYSVECREELPFGDPILAETMMAGYPTDLTDTLLADLADMYIICQLWRAGQPDPIEDLPVSSDIPTLLMAGEYDPVTPPSWAELAAQTLTQHELIIIPRGGHSLIDAGDCPVGIMQAFLDDPAASIDAQCVAEMTLPFE